MASIGHAHMERPAQLHRAGFVQPLSSINLQKVPASEQGRRDLSAEGMPQNASYRISSVASFH